MNGQHCDIYQLYREPAVQDFLRPARAGLGNTSKTDAVAQTLLEIEQLALKNAFFALTSIDNNNPRIVGGFHFRGTQEEAERIIGKWRSIDGAKLKSPARENTISRPRNRGHQNGVVECRDRL